MARLIEEAQGLLEQPAQPPAGDVVERMWKVNNPDIPGSIHPNSVAVQRMTAALAVARDGYVSLDERDAQWEKAIRAQHPNPAAGNYFIEQVKARLAKPAERVTVTADGYGWSVTVDGIRHVAWFFECMDAERYAAGLREELKAGKQ